MLVVNHPDSFRVGTRVLMLKGRHKDKAHGQRCVLKVTHATEGFDDALAELCSMAHPGERIYGSAGARSMNAAIREFKRKQLDADYDDDPERFYRGIEARWASALMQPTSQAEKYWLFDCDTPGQGAMVMAALEGRDYGGFLYTYASKNGQHIITRPFDRSKISAEARALIHENPQMLWAWAE